MTGAKPVLAIASVGSSLVPETVRLVVGTLANRLDPLAAMAAPPLLINMEPMKPGESFLTKPELIPEGAYDLEFLQHLRESGVNIEQKSQQEVYGIKGTAVMERSIRRLMLCAVLRLPASMALRLLTDPIGS